MGFSKKKLEFCSKSLELAVLYVSQMVLVLKFPQNVQNVEGFLRKKRRLELFKIDKCCIFFQIASQKVLLPKNTQNVHKVCFFLEKEMCFFGRKL